jgi:DNA-binding transcriptional ArsR family regulator
VNDRLGNDTDTGICRLLAAEPLPTAVLAAQLGVPVRTVRHRLYRLRQAGLVVTGAHGRYALAALVTQPVEVAVDAGLASGPKVPDTTPATGLTGTLTGIRTLAVAGSLLAVVVWTAMVARRRPPGPPPSPSPLPWGPLDPGGWGSGPR